ncbi:carbohydrate sulfotransferase 11-like [Acanthaster planci]|uniref:Carbohydrate sulfotransferase n=1 Tax=Acanthaster planci TaxID=133434 RepID=A0A8B7ZFB3_ACAPL|nr:carbohydrate sulfotransferase 11-like [Acanthaster planci]
MSNVSMRCVLFGLAMMALALFVGIQRFGLPAVLARGPIPVKKLHAKRGKDPLHEKSGSDRSCNNQTCLWDEEQLYRKSLVWDMCHAIHAEGNTHNYPPLRYRLSRDTPRQASLFSHFLVIESMKLIYCFIPKVSCTSWKRLLLFMSGKYNSMKDIGQWQTHVLALKEFRVLSSYSVEDIENLLATYRTFVFVRNPFERILSAYQDKFQEDYPASKLTRKQYSERIIRQTGGSPENVQKLLTTQRRKDGTLNVTFWQFVRFVSSLDGPRTKQYMNDHWAQMYQMCHPCLVDYDWIGHYDSLRIDADSILTAAGFDPQFRFPNFTTNPTGSSNEDTLLRYYSTLTTSEIEALYKYYELDFSLFGFDIPRTIRNLLNSRGRSDNYTLNGRTNFAITSS